VAGVDIDRVEDDHVTFAALKAVHGAAFDLAGQILVRG
jgi:hypothetical protein